MPSFLAILEKVGARLEKSVADQQNMAGPRLPADQQRLNQLADFSGFVNRRTEDVGMVGAGAANAQHFITQGSPFGAIGGAAEGLGKNMMESGNPFAMAGGAVIKFGGMIVSATDKVKEWVNQLHDSNMQFAEFSASMSAVQAEQEIRDQQLNMEKGESRAESARDLAEAKSRLDQQTAGLENVWARLKNNVGAFSADLVGGFIKPLTVFGDWVNKITGGENEDRGAFAVIREATKKAYESRPKRFSNGGGGDF